MKGFWQPAAIVIGVVMGLSQTTPAHCIDHNTVRVPCRDMGDGRILVDSLYLPDWADETNPNYKIIAKRPTAMQGEWANLVCTLRIKTHG